MIGADAMVRCLEEEGITNVLVLENIEELCTAKNISLLRMQ